MNNLIITQLAGIQEYDYGAKFTGTPNLRGKVDNYAHFLRFPGKIRSYRRGVQISFFYLELDVQQFDKYNRLLAYVWLSKPSVISISYYDNTRSMLSSFSKDMPK